MDDSECAKAHPEFVGLENGRRRLVIKKYGNCGFTSFVDDGKLTVEIPIENLVTAFEYSEVNGDELSIKEGKHGEFAEFVAEHIVDECNPHDGATYMCEAIDRVFDLLFEGFEDGQDFVEQEVGDKGGGAQ
jgi:hypothetical protein